jgi:photosystem II stability/assembly factor-like uncharacterized protein
MVMQNGHMFIADTRMGFYRSTDGGANWSARNNGLQVTSGNISAWSVVEVPATHTLIATLIPNGTADFYRSTDEGANWTAISCSPIACDYHNNAWPAKIAADGTIILTGWYTPGTHSAVFYSTDDGQTAHEAGTSPTAASVYGSAFLNPNNNNLWLGTEALGLYKSTDNGRNWSQIFLNAGQTGDNRAWAVNASGQLLTIGSNNGTRLIRSTDASGTAWSTLINVSNDPNWDLISDSNHVLYLSRRSTILQRSADGGTTWTIMASGLPSGAQVQYMTISPVDGRIYAAVRGTTIYRTVDPVQ